MPLKVIGAGAPRTGTTSLKLALERLGIAPCCHMWELLKPEHAWRWLLWKRAFEGKNIDWEKLFRGFAATVDAPGSFFWRKLARAYPDAKVILTVRDPDSWMHSMQSMTEAAQEQIDPKQITPLVRTTLGMMAAAIARERGVPPEPPPGPERERYVRENYLRDIDQVMREIPRERLLVFDVREGWEPLCRFLGVPVPEETFPHENTAETFIDRLGASTAQQRRN